MRKHKSAIADIESNWFCKYFRPFIMSEDTGITELIHYGMKLGVELGVKSLPFVEKYVTCLLWSAALFCGLFLVFFILLAALFVTHYYLSP